MKCYLCDGHNHDGDYPICDEHFAQIQAQTSDVPCGTCGFYGPDVRLVVFRGFQCADCR